MIESWSCSSIKAFNAHALHNGLGCTNASLSQVNVNTEDAKGCTLFNDEEEMEEDNHNILSNSLDLALDMCDNASSNKTVRNSKEGVVIAIRLVLLSVVATVETVAAAVIVVVLAAVDVGVDGVDGVVVGVTSFNTSASDNVFVVEVGYVAVIKRFTKGVNTSYMWSGEALDDREDLPDAADTIAVDEPTVFSECSNGPRYLTSFKKSKKINNTLGDCNSFCSNKCIFFSFSIFSEFSETF